MPLHFRFLLFAVLFTLGLTPFKSYAAPSNPVGFVDLVNCNGVTGWAADLNSPNTSVQVEITDIHGSHIDVYFAIPANQPRPDVRDKVTHDNGLHGFTYKFNCNLSIEPHLISVRISGASSELGNSPQNLVCPSAADSSAPEAFGTCLGSFNGVAAYSNGNDRLGSSYFRCYYDGNCKNSIGANVTGVMWQCVEFVRRYYLSVYGRDISSSKVSDANAWFINAPKFLGFVAYSNGGTVAPQVGDILTSSKGKHGHVAIVRNVGQNQLCTIQQNFSRNYSDTYKCIDLAVTTDPPTGLKHYTLNGFNNKVGAKDGLPIQGWLRLATANARTEAFERDEPRSSAVQSTLSCASGSSQGFRINNAPPMHPNGSLIKTSSDPTVYLLQNGKRRPIPSPEILYYLFENGEFDFSDVITIDADEMTLYPLGATVTGTLPSNNKALPDGRLMKQVGEPEISIVADNGSRRPFISEKVFLGLGYQYCNVVEVEDYNTYPQEAAIDGTSILTSSYVGSIDGADCNALFGWAADRSRPNVPINVTLYDDATPIAVVVASDSRSDIGAYLNDNGEHGFTIPIPSTLKNGVAHTLSVKFDATTISLPNSDNRTTNTRSLACTGNANYEGYVDGADCDSIWGWAADRNQLDTSINVVLYDGPTPLFTVGTAGLRSDVGNYLNDNGLHGFIISIPTSLKDGAAHTLSVKFEGTNTSLLDSNNPSANTRVLTCTTASNYEGYVDSADCDSISGWAADRSKLNSTINVTLYDGSTPLATAPANASRSDVGGYLHDNGLHGFTIPIPVSLKKGVAHTLSVKFEGTGTSLLNSNYPSTNTRTLTCVAGANYEGYVDRADCDSISGWAADRAQLNTPINVTFYDGATPLTTVTANGARTDVGGYLHDNGLHGFTIPIPASLKNGVAHTLSVKFEGTTSSLLNSNNTATNTRTLTCSVGTNYEGYVDRADCDSVSGWAADRNQPNTAINVTLYDGATPLTTVPATGSRSDVGGYLHDNGLHGFTIPIPASLKNGVAHTLSVKFESTNTSLLNSNNTATNTRSLTCSVGTNDEGYVDRADCDSVSGWAADRNQPNTAINVTLYDGATPLTTVPANGSRPDVGNYLHDNGLHGFTIPIPSSLKNGVAHTLSVKFEGANTALLNSNNTSTNTRSVTCVTTSSPSVSSINPNPVPLFNDNQSVQVSGSGFRSNLTVDVFNGSGTKIGSLSGSAQVQNVSSNSFTMVIFLGSNAGSFGIEVVNPDTGRSPRFPFDGVAPNPSISQMNPNPLSLFNADQSVQVSGSSFQKGLTVDVFNSNGTKVGTLSGSAQVQNVTPNSFTMVVSLGSSAADFGIEVVNPNGGRSSRKTLSTIAPNPSASSISPNPVPIFNGNQNVQVSGSNFQNGLTVDVFNSAGTKIGTLSGSGQIKSVTPGSFTMVISLGGVASSFGFEVVNANGGRSTRFPFQYK